MTSPQVRSQLDENILRLIAQSILDENEIVTPPTPVQDLLDHYELTWRSFNFSQIVGSGARQDGAKLDKHPRLLALLDASNRNIYVHSSLSEERLRFCLLHEIAHFIMNGGAFVGCSETDLLEGCEQEIAANRLASYLLFQLDGFILSASSYRLGLQAVVGLAKNYRASLEATGRYYVETRREPCSLLIGTITGITDESRPGSDSRRIVIKHAYSSGTFPGDPLRGIRIGSALSKELLQRQQPAVSGLRIPVSRCERPTRARSRALVSYVSCRAEVLVASSRVVLFVTPE